MAVRTYKLVCAWCIDDYGWETIASKLVATPKGTYPACDDCARQGHEHNGWKLETISYEFDIDHDEQTRHYIDALKKLGETPRI